MVLAPWETSSLDKMFVTDIFEQTIWPSKISRHVNDFAPAALWKFDVMEERGGKKLQAVIQEVLKRCVPLQDIE
jgi:hypothetical protein